MKRYKAHLKPLEFIMDEEIMRRYSPEEYALSGLSIKDIDIDSIEEVVEAIDDYGNDPNQRWEWRTSQKSLLDNLPCCDKCNERHRKIKFTDGWRKLGLPRGGWCDCENNCECQLVPYNGAWF